MKKHSPRSQGQPEPSSVSEQETPAIIPPKPPGKGLLRAFTSLRQRNFRLFWFGQMISLIGSYMQTIGQAWLVLELTHSAWQLGLVGALQSLPVLLFSLFGGVFADRWPKRRVLLLTQAAAMIQALLLWALIATGTIQLWHLYVLAMLLGLTNSLDHPTRQAFVIELVGREDLPNAVALNASLSQLTRVVGPGMAGIIIAASSVTMLFLLNALSFLAVLVGLALIKSHELHAQALQRRSVGERQNAWQSLREGVAYVWNTPGGWPGVALWLELQRRAPPLRYRRAAWRSNGLWLSLCRVRHWLALLGAVAGLGQPEANDPPRADRHAGLRGVGGGVCGLAHLSPVISAHCERWLCGDSLCSAFHYHAPNGRPGPPARAGHERDSALLRRKCPAGISTDGLAVRSLWGSHRHAHRCASQPGGRGSRVDMA